MHPVTFPGPTRGWPLALLLLCACGAPSEAVHSPATCGPQRAFHVVSHGWHAGIVVPAADLAAREPDLAAHLGAARLVEIGWGDAAFYRAPDPGAALALRALLYPTDTVLHVVAMADADPRERFPDAEVITLSVPASGFDRLLDHVLQTFARDPDGAPIALERGLYGESRFYRARGAFHAFNTCNTWVARAIATTGYPLETTSVVRAGTLLREIRRAPDRPCHGAR